MTSKDAAGSSRRKPTKKAATQSRSTTSSTTARAVSTPPVDPDVIGVPDLRLLTGDEQQQVWSYLVKGASPQLACRELGLSLRRFWTTLDRDPQFAIAMEHLFRTLSHNVLAALYQRAMKGDKTAQQAWLRVMPPFVGINSSSGETDDDLATLSDAELLERARATGVTLPDEIAARLLSTRGGPSPGGLSGRAADLDG